MRNDPGEQSQVPRVDLDVVLGPDAHRLRVTGTIVLPAETSPRGTLLFLLRTDADDLRIDVLDPPVCRGPVVVREIERVPNMAATQRLEGELPTTCPPEVPLVLSVSYACGSEENRRWLNLSSEFCFSSTYASAWLPAFGYRRGSGTIRYSVPKEMVVVASGSRSSVDSRDDRVVFTYTADSPTVFDFVAGPYTVQRREGPVPVSVYHLQPLAGAEEILERTERILGVLEVEFGPYPFAELAVVEAPMGPAVYAGIEGGAYPGYFLVRSDLLQVDNFEDWVVGHELTHFWFPHMVGHREEAVAPAMLDEALAHYGALRVVEALGGPATAERFRREGGAEAIRLTAAGFDHALAGASTTERWDRVAYNFSNTKGHLVYDMLAREIGRKRFQSALQRVIREHAGRDIAWSDFWNSIHDDAGQGLQWFYAQWLDSSSLPVLSLEWSQVDGRLKCVVTQSKPPLRLDVPLQIELVDATALMRTIKVAGERTDIEIPTETTVHSVRLDPHYTILHATPEQWAEAEARRFVTRAELLWEDDEVDQALEVLQQGAEQIPEVDVWGIEFLTRLNIGGIHQERGRSEQALTEYELALGCAIRPADHLARLYLNLATIARDQGDSDRMWWAATNVLTAEESQDIETEAGREARQMLTAVAAPVVP